MANFVFYDTETTGTDTAFDQIMQFAAVLTDAELNELDRLEVRCRLLPHVVPAPGALLVTRTSPSRLTDPSLPSHYEAMRLVASKLDSWAPAIFLGYNSIEFDEKMLRQAFYQTLQPIYLTNTRGSVRADVLRLVQAASVFAPDCLTIPMAANGKETRRLDAIAPANGFAHANAHDALADVEATIFVAKLIRNSAAELWSTMMALASKRQALARLNDCELMVLSEFYGGRAYSWPVVGCGCAPEADSLGCVFDLRFDPEDFLQLSEDELVAVMHGPRKALRYVAANKQPILLPISFVRDGRSGINVKDEVIMRRANIVADDDEFRKRACRALAKRFEKEGEPAEQVEERIYDHFPSSSDQQLMRTFHLVPWEQRIAIVSQLADPRFRELGYRLIHTEQPQILPGSVRAQLDAWRRERLLGIAGTPYRTIADAIREADDTVATTEDEHQGLVPELRRWLTEWRDVTKVTVPDEPKAA